MLDFLKQNVFKAEAFQIISDEEAYLYLCRNSTNKFMNIETLSENLVKIIKLTVTGGL